VADDAVPTAKVLFRVPYQDGSVEIETLWAFELGNDKFKIDNCPFYAYDVSLGDVVLAPFDKQENFPTFQKVLSKSRNRTVRIVFDSSALPDVSREVLTALVALGCGYEGAKSRYFAVNVPPASDLFAVTDFLTKTGIMWERADPEI
jgi:hypothetical protein